MFLSKLSLIVGSCLTIAMVIFHFFFPKLFKWEKDFQRITGTNKRIFFTINVALYLLFIIIALISLLHINELAQCTGIGFTFLLLISFFWLWRTIWQIVYFKPEKGSKLIVMHVILILIFLLLCLSYITPILIFRIIWVKIAQQPIWGSAPFGRATSHIGKTLCDMLCHYSSLIISCFMFS